MLILRSHTCAWQRVLCFKCLSFITRGPALLVFVLDCVTSWRQSTLSTKTVSPDAVFQLNAFSDLSRLLFSHKWPEEHRTPPNESRMCHDHEVTKKVCCATFTATQAEPCAGRIQCCNGTSSQPWIYHRLLFLLPACQHRQIQLLPGRRVPAVSVNCKICSLYCNSPPVLRASCGVPEFGLRCM